MIISHIHVHLSSVSVVIDSFFHTRILYEASLLKGEAISKALIESKSTR